MRDVSQLQRAMSGNVTSYAMDTKGVVSMVEEKLVPRWPTILATIVSVTYILWPWTIVQSLTAANFPSAQRGGTRGTLMVEGQQPTLH